MIDLATYGIKGDGVTDDGPAWQKLIDANPGRRIEAPRTATNGSGPSYFCGQTLKVMDPGTMFQGEGGGDEGGTVFEFPPGVTGFDVRGAGSTVQDLVLFGAERWSGSWFYEAVLPLGMGGDSAADGIRVASNYITLRNLTIEGFGRHGVNASNQDTGGTSDDCLFDRLFLGHNRGHGFNIDGGDSNSCVWIACVYYVNQCWGKRAASFLSGTHIGDQATQNGFDDTARNATSPVVPIDHAIRVGDRIALKLQRDYPWVFAPGHGVTIWGASEPSFNGTFLVSSTQNKDALILISPGPSSGIPKGFARMATPTETWHAARCQGGAYCAPINNSRQVWINPYAEGGQRVAMTSANLVHAPVWNASYDPQVGLPGQFDAALVGLGSLGSNQPVSTVWPLDQRAVQFDRIGATKPQPLMRYYQDPVTYHTIWKQVTSAEEWSLWEGDALTDPAAWVRFRVPTQGPIYLNGGARLNGALTLIPIHDAQAPSPCGLYHSIEQDAPCFKKADGRVVRFGTVS